MGLINMRNIDYVKQSSIILFFKITSVGATFLLIPLMIDNLGVEYFGVWATILSLVSWLALLDFGMSSGLRNKISECLVGSRKSQLKDYINSSYTVIGITSILVMVGASILIGYIPWNSVLKIDSIDNDTLQKIMFLMINLTIINTWIGLINSILAGHNKNSLIIISQTVVNIIVLIAFNYFNKQISGSILITGMIFTGSTLIVAIIISIWFYKNNYYLIPKLTLKIKNIKELSNLSVKFLAIQIATLILFTTDRLILIQIIGPSAVTEYEVMLRLFSIVTIFHAMITAPLWTSYANSYHEGDLIWIKKMMISQIKILTVLTVLILVLIFNSEFIISKWIRGYQINNSNVSIFMGVFTLICLWNNIFGTFINATSKLWPQIITSIIVILINIPLSITLGKNYGYGINGVIVANILCLALPGIVLPYQAYRILKK
jgi:O-antigen/teichoic acid export membrane protein